MYVVENLGHHAHVWETEERTTGYDQKNRLIKNKNESRYKKYHEINVQNTAQIVE